MIAVPSKSKSAGKASKKHTRKATASVRRTELFPTVGVGASAGGIEAISELLEALGDSPGVAVVIVLHQEPKRPSMLTAVLARATAMPIEEIKGRTPLRQNHVYVAPPGDDVFVERSVLLLRKRPPGHSWPIDAFLRSLAEDQRSRAIAVKRHQHFRVESLLVALDAGESGNADLRSRGNIVERKTARLPSLANLCA